MIYIALLLTIYTMCKLLLDLHQINYIKSISISEQEIDRLSIDQNFIDKSNSYAIHKLYLSIFSTLITVVFVYLILLGMVSIL